ncbi:peptidase M56 [Rhodanobacter glycinis]|uniref:Peptidase M56 n=1 Tax=Rhodanobacter glycinis TaxID=582702 RepID=A0A502C7F6_9GAMM|nr:M56 family metallopeptidase [Rhodanobacter glycinis]TPG08630.1 peptidase M56 [Rhodanobacter glycinis]TPG47821.1 peptidase M56 [Rhodanobacter glycinis]
MNIDLASIDWIGRGWLLILAFTAAAICVALLRKPCRRAFGAEHAFQLWLLVPLAMLASQLPHIAGTDRAPLPSLVYMITSVVGASPIHASASTSIGWRSCAGLVWLAGIVASLALAAMAQSRYRSRLRGATPMAHAPSRWPVLRAANADVGPALVGAWQARIVLPADFERRYGAIERALILAHEAMHARRRDGWWCLLAQIVSAMFWFHPLAWWALGALRHDQELACDAAVLREHGAQRRSYANAMLKTQSALFALPVGCPWSPRHPLTERIAMLKLPLPGRLRRSTGSMVVVMLACVVAGSVYAASAPSGQRHGTVQGSAAVDEYQLDMMVELTTGDAHASPAERMTLALCMAPGKSGTVSTHGWTIEATPSPEGESRLRIDLAVTGAGGEPVAHTQLHGALGEAVHAEGRGEDGKHGYAVDITSLAGCPARTATTADTGARLRLISQAVRNESARAVAVSVALGAGLTLVNPEALDNRLVTLNFDKIPAERAMQLIADVDGAKAVFDGNRVHFEPK